MAKLPSPYPFRDLFDGAVRYSAVKLTCKRCKHAQILRAAALWWLFYRNGWADRFGDVQRRCYCLLCYHRRGEKVHYPALEFVDVEPTDDSLPMPSELDWKREQRRRR